MDYQLAALSASIWTVAVPQVESACATAMGCGIQHATATSNESVQSQTLDYYRQLTCLPSIELV